MNLAATTINQRIVSGMRATGPLHLGHYHGAIKNWVQLQHQYECFLFVADWHALTTHYADPSEIEHNTRQVIIDWLAGGVNPGTAHIFIQSQIPEHAELHLLLSMLTPLSWLERVPTYKEQQERLQDRDLSTYGFLGYPLLQCADILIYRPSFVPVGEDQAPHVELSREVARRFNYFYGRDADFVAKAQEAITKLGKKQGKRYRDYLRRYQEQGEQEALSQGQALLETQNNLSVGDRDRLLGYLEGGGRIILPEPQVLLTSTPRLPGVDGQKMSKSYGNGIYLRDEPAVVEEKLRTMQTDPARVRRTDPGEPEKCPVWDLHKVYSDDDCRAWVAQGCRSASIGCLDCKRPLIDNVQAELTPMRERAQEYESKPELLRTVVAEGAQAARSVAQETLNEVREVMGVSQGGL